MRLLEFNNYLRIALTILPANNHKGLLLDICGRLEGLSPTKYITGGGMSVRTERRVTIYEVEGRVTRRRRGPRLQAPPPNTHNRITFIPNGSLADDFLPALLTSTSSSQSHITIPNPSQEVGDFTFTEDDWSLIVEATQPVFSL